MISIEVARELRDFGFPQEDHFFYWWEETDAPTWWNIYALEKQSPNWHKTAAAPLLEDLIKRCNRPFWLESNVDQDGDVFYAGAFHGIGEKYGKGKTPEDATARFLMLTY